ncbi:MAG TPA: Na+/H+ antiporter NhaC family protein [Clostridia bacterium]|nr:Na+/H+ antiporter NhaC family protein [Clostridia bacterium]
MVWLWIYWIILSVAVYFIPANSIKGTALTLIPAVSMFIYVYVSRDFLQGFCFGTILLIEMMNKGRTPVVFINSMLGQLTDSDNMFMLLTFFTCGATISALHKSGSAKSFGVWMAKKIKNKKLNLIATFIMTALMSVDDYINSLTVGTAMTPINDEAGIPREMTSYVIRSSNSAPGLFYPFGDWAYFIILQLVSLKLAKDLSHAVPLYMSFVPYLFYPMVVMLVSLLVIFGVIPKIGKMKDAYHRVETGGGVLSPNSKEDVDEEVEELLRQKDVNPINFAIPVLTLFAGMILTHFNGVQAGILTLVVTGLLYIPQGIFTLNEYVQVMMDGFKDMLDLSLLLVFGYMIGDSMSALGFSDFIVGVARHALIPQLLPVVVFLLFCCTEYLCTLNWTLYIIAMPILFKVCPAIGANLPLTIAALISAGLFGSNTCIFSDGGVVVSKGSRIDLYDHGFSSMPYMIIAGVASAVLYLGAGFVFHV